MAQLDQCALLGSNDLEFFALQDAWEMTDSHYDTLKMVLMIDRGGKDPCVLLLRDPLCPSPLLAGFQPLSAMVYSGRYLHLFLPWHALLQCWLDLQAKLQGPCGEFT